MKVSVELHVPTALPSRRKSGTHCIEVWVVLKAIIDGSGEEKMSCSCLDSNPDLLNPQRVVVPNTLWRFP